MFRERIIVEDSLVADATGYAIRARLPWYRGLPLSSLVELRLAVDGLVVGQDALTIETDGVQRPLGDAAQAWNESWYVLDDLVVRASGVPLAELDLHEVDLTISLRIPYLPVNGEPLTITEHYATTMAATVPAA